MKTFFLLIALAVTSKGMAQFFGPYYDSTGMWVRFLELGAAKNLESAVKKTSLEYAKVTLVNMKEKSSRSRHNFDSKGSAFIKYKDYKNVCNYYWNPFNKRKCQNKFNYLTSAHKQVLRIMKFNTYSYVNEGVKEQIGEKYTAITHAILRELEEMKNIAERKRFLKFLKRN